MEGIAYGTDAWSRRNGGKFRRTVETDQGAGLTETRFGDLQILVGHRHLLCQRVELRITKHLPPVAPQCMVAGLCDLPTVPRRWRLFVGRRHGYWWLDIVGADHATRKQQRREADEVETKVHHGADHPAGCGLD